MEDAEYLKCLPALFSEMSRQRTQSPVAARLRPATAALPNARPQPSMRPCASFTASPPPRSQSNTRSRPRTAQVVGSAEVIMEPTAGCDDASSPPDVVTGIGERSGLAWNTERAVAQRESSQNALRQQGELVSTVEAIMHSIALLERSTRVGDGNGIATGRSDSEFVNSMMTTANEGAAEPVDLDTLADVRQHVDLLIAAMEGEQRIALFGELGRFFDRKGKDAAFEQKRLDMLEFSQVEADQEADVGITLVDKNLSAKRVSTFSVLNAFFKLLKKLARKPGVASAGASSTAAHEFDLFEAEVSALTSRVRSVDDGEAERLRLELMLEMWKSRCLEHEERIRALVTVQLGGQTASATGCATSALDGAREKNTSLARLVVQAQEKVAEWPRGSRLGADLSFNKIKLEGELERSRREVSALQLRVDADKEEAQRIFAIELRTVYDERIATLSSALEDQIRRAEQLQNAADAAEAKSSVNRERCEKLLFDVHDLEQRLAASRIEVNTTSLQLKESALQLQTARKAKFVENEVNKVEASIDSQLSDMLRRLDLFEAENGVLKTEKRALQEQLMTLERQISQLSAHQSHSQTAATSVAPSGAATAAAVAVPLGILDHVTHDSLQRVFSSCMTSDELTSLWKYLGELNTYFAGRFEPSVIDGEVARRKECMSNIRALVVRLEDQIDSVHVGFGAVTDNRQSARDSHAAAPYSLDALESQRSVLNACILLLEREVSALESSNRSAPELNLASLPLTAHRWRCELDDLTHGLGIVCQMSNPFFLATSAQSAATAPSTCASSRLQNPREIEAIRRANAELRTKLRDMEHVAMRAKYGSFSKQNMTDKRALQSSTKEELTAQVAILRSEVKASRRSLAWWRSRWAMRAVSPPNGASESLVNGDNPHEMIVSPPPRDDLRAGIGSPAQLAPRTTQVTVSQLSSAAASLRAHTALGASYIQSLTDKYSRTEQKKMERTRGTCAHSFVSAQSPSVIFDDHVNLKSAAVQPVTVDPFKTAIDEPENSNLQDHHLHRHQLSVAAANFQRFRQTLPSLGALFKSSKFAAPNLSVRSAGVAISGATDGVPAPASRASILIGATRHVSPSLAGGTLTPRPPSAPTIAPTSKTSATTGGVSSPLTSSSSSFNVTGTKRPMQLIARGYLS